MSTNTSHDIFDAMAQHWPSAVVTSPKVKDFTGGIITGKTLANHAALGHPVPESLKINGKRAYIASSLVDWLRNRSKGGTQ